MSSRAAHAVRLQVHPTLEWLERRFLFAGVSVDVDQVIRPVNTDMHATNIAWWGLELLTDRIKDMVRANNIKLFRLPGGSTSNNQHFDTSNPGDWYNSPPELANWVKELGGDAMVQVNYGTGSPQEAAAYLAYYNARIGDDTVLGVGKQWDDNSGTWVNKDWKTAGYWASIRAASPMAVDDGLNHLRAGRTAPWNFSYYEVGNENYAVWENDKHGEGGAPGGPQDAETYAAFAAEFDALARQIDPDVKIGLVTTLPLRWNQPDLLWTDNVLAGVAARGMTPGFLSDHVYVLRLDDQDLLLNTVNAPVFEHDEWLVPNANWAGRSDYYRTRLNATFGAAGADIPVMLTEFNADFTNKQIVNLPGGLWIADAVAGLMQHPDYTAAIHWDLLNGYTPRPGMDTHLYGWREGTDNGMIGTSGFPDNSNPPENGSYIPYPTYFAMQLLSKFVDNGGEVVRAISNDPYLAAYAVRQADGDLSLMVINKDPENDRSGTFDLSGFATAPNARFWQYGKAEDTAQSQTSDGASSLTTWTSRLTMSDGRFAQSFPSYSMTVIELDAGARHTVLGTPGNDVILVTGNGNSVQIYLNDELQTLPSNMNELLIDAGSGHDQVLVTSTVTMRLLITGSGGNDTIVGGSGSDELSGASGKDRVFGGRGDDYLLGGKHNDYLSGDAGDDQLSGGGGKDRLYGAAGNNRLRGGAQDDVLFSDNGARDTVSGHAGYDILVDPDDEDLEVMASIEQILRTRS